MCLRLAEKADFAVREHSVNVDGCRLYVRETGQGQPVLMAHCLFGDSRIFEGLTGHLKRFFRCVAFDARGHGRSEVPVSEYSMTDQACDCGRVMDYLSIDKAVLVGVSMGGLAVLRFAATCPGRVSAVVVLDTDAGAPPFRRRFARMCLVMAVRLFGFRRWMANNALKRMFSGNFLNAEPGVASVFRKAMEALSPLAVSKAVRAVDTRSSIVELLPRIKAPTLVLFGADDVYTPPSCGRIIASSVPDSVFELVGRAGHLAVVERPAYIAELIEGFLREKTGRAIIKET